MASTITVTLLSRYCKGSSKAKCGRRLSVGSGSTLLLSLLSCLFLIACGGVSANRNIALPPPAAPACATGSNPAEVSVRSQAILSSATPIPPQFFGFNLHPQVLQIGTNPYPWPTIPFGAVRLWATETTWNVLNPSLNNYDWTNLDQVLSISAQNRQTDFIYTFGVVPPWASSVPNDQTCVTNNSPAGSCDPPVDVDTTDLYWKNFVTAITAHNAQKGFPIHTWEIWNEPDILIEWNGTAAQMARMAKDAYTIIKAADPTALVTTPTPGNAGSGQNIGNWLPGYLSAALSLGGPFADIVTFHGYVDPSQGDQPEQEITTVNTVTSAIASVPTLSSKPVWDTEGAWGDDTKLPDPDMQAAYLARMYLLQWSQGVSRFYWFQYGNRKTGTLWTPTGGLDPAGEAYGQLYDWMTGATLTSPCSQSGSVWTCDFTHGSIQEQAVWDASQTCRSGVCTTSNFTPSTAYTQCSDLAGNKRTFSAGTAVGIGAKQVLLESQ